MAQTDAERARRYRERRLGPLLPRACEHCGAVFTPARLRTARYCCANCRSQARFERDRQRRQAQRDS
jgi:uncharacterized OB-fold protein